MRVILSGLVAAVLVAAAGGAAGQDAKVDGKLLLGKWAPKEKAGGKEFTVEFARDGKFVFVATGGGKEFKVEGSYKVDGNKLSMTTGKNSTRVRTIDSLTKTELVSTDDQGKKDTLVRVGGKETGAEKK